FCDEGWQGVCTQISKKIISLKTFCDQLMPMPCQLNTYQGGRG
ncbi:MAG: hypothetical protein ACI8Z9_002545, partial [Paraglaciecola sp.]